MSRMSRVQMAAAMLIALASPQHQAAIEAMSSLPSVAGSPWRTKLRNTRTTVAAMKRAARKRRNLRARAAK